MSTHVSGARPRPDQVMVDIADYVVNYKINSAEAYDTARQCLMDSLGCAMEALSYPACTKLLGPIVAGTVVPDGAKVPGTSFQLDPVLAAFNIACMVRWVDFSDTWLAAEAGHPSDNLGGILATADYLSRVNVSAGRKPLVMRDVLTALIKAYEIQGVIALKNSFHAVGLDGSVGLAKIGSTAVITAMLGGTRDEIINAVSNAWVDGQTLRVFRHAPNAGSRKSWAAADAASRSVRLALMTLKGEMGYPTALTAKRWGLYDVAFKGKPFTFQRPYGSYVVENVLFKISYPTAFHCQPAVECALKLHAQVGDRLDEIKKIVLTTHENLIRISDKKGPLSNPADRDHCVRYTTAVPLIKGSLTAADYEDDVAADPRIDRLRDKMVCVENKQWNRDYLDPKKRSVPCAVQVFFNDGSKTDDVLVEYPLGHRRRRQEGLPLLEAKFRTNLARRFTPERQAAILGLCKDQRRLEATAVNEFVDLFVD
ncbi:MAG: bifunctional 2-methylcitrate dehydratase/aconitate hydratase [Betaproteobacteria bacterium]|nr:bifunctional 2-methylcitrate dehydratase/aconitate hydratase [Betaproteobacteria bacterium]